MCPADFQMVVSVRFREAERMNKAEVQVEYLRRIKTAYQLTFQDEQPANQEVLADFARFCRAGETCFVKGDPEQTLIYEGRRQAWLHLTQYLHLNAEQLYVLYTLRSGSPAA